MRKGAKGETEWEREKSKKEWKIGKIGKRER